MQRKSILTLAVLTALLNTCYVGSVYAAEGEDAAATETVAVAEAAAEQIMTRDVVVTASRTEQEIKETPAAVEVINREDIEKLGANTLAQALQQAIGIDVSENGMVGNSVKIRGAASNQTLILIDGERVRTENTNQTANNYELQRINMADVERIEIVRGAVSSLYGADAMGGVINVITKTPDKEAYSISADWNTKQTGLGFRAATGMVGKWAGSFSYRHDELNRRDINGSVPTHGRKNYYDIKAKYKIDDKRDLTFNINQLREDTYLESDFTKYDHIRTKYGITYAGKDKKGDYKFNLNYSYFTKDQETRNAGTLKGFDDMKFSTWTLDGQRTMQLGDNHLLTFGGELRREKYEGTRLAAGGDNVHTVTREGVSQDYSEKATNYAALYLQDEWMVNDRWLSIPSIRFDNNSTFGSKVTYKLGNTVHLSDNTRVKLNIGTAYRAPTEAELYMNWHHTPVSMPMMKMNVFVQGNPDLKPETSLNFDVGVEAENNHGTSAKLTYFHNSFKDLINGVSATTRTPGMPMIINVVSKYQNIDKATIQGVEAEVKQKLGGFFNLRGTYTYTDAVDGNNARLEGRDRHKFSLQLNYDNPGDGWSGSLWSDWHLDYWASDSTGTKKSNSTNVLNFVANKKLGESCSAYFGVDNIMDKKDANDYTVFGLSGRIWRTGINWTF